MVGTAILGHGTLAVHQEAVPAALLRQRRLVPLSDEGVQLSLLTADGLHKLMGNTDGNKCLTGTTNLAGLYKDSGSRSYVTLKCFKNSIHANIGAP